MPLRIVAFTAPIVHRHVCVRESVQTHVYTCLRTSGTCTSASCVCTSEFIYACLYANIHACIHNSHYFASRGFDVRAIVSWHACMSMCISDYVTSETWRVVAIHTSGYAYTFKISRRLRWVEGFSAAWPYARGWKCACLHICVGIHTHTHTHTHTISRMIGWAPAYRGWVQYGHM